MKTLSFSNITFADLARIVDIKQVTNDEVFHAWFSYAYPLNDAEKEFLAALLAENRPFMLSYSEDELKIKFIGPLLNKVNYRFDGLRDWYQRPLKAKINRTIIGGYVDFMVAKGFKEPEKSYFFIQAFKKTKIAVDPEDQLLAEMLVALELNHVQVMHGAYIIGPQWRFGVLRQVAVGQYEYYVSLIFDSDNPDELQRIYSNLQAVKALFCRVETE